MPEIIVVGSINCDVSIFVDRLPVAGETVIGSDCMLSIGGKGFNQALAARRAGANVALVACVGDDRFGRKAIAAVAQAGIGSANIRVLPSAMTGVASITVSCKAENMIAVSPGANAELGAADVENAKTAIGAAGAVVAQLETPVAAVEAAFRTARAKSVMTILNPAPANIAALSLLPLVDIATPNASELTLLSGIELANGRESLIAAMDVLVRRGTRQVITTLGAQGAAMWDGHNFVYFNGLAVDAVDTSGAGDVFTGVLAATLNTGAAMSNAIMRAQCAAALSVTRPSASSAPSAAEVTSFMALLGDHQVRHEN